MAQTESALAEATQYARDCLDIGRDSARVVSVHCLVNGYDQAHKRSECFYGYAVETQSADGTDTLVIFPQAEIPNAESCLFIIDDGRTVTPRYVAGWHAEKGRLYLQPFPVNVDSNGQPRMRADDPTRPVDFSGWMLSVRRAYHVKLIRRPEGC